MNLFCLLKEALVYQADQDVSYICLTADINAGQRTLYKQKAVPFHIRLFFEPIQTVCDECLVVMTLCNMFAKAGAAV